ncbi:Glutaredoxin-like domain-containing protein [Cladophialophora immunda]|nr:Glutaredoxin-like domain-containing protein [Cladophialophora immunda]
MRPSLALRLSHIRLTLFTRANCGLCDVAKARVGEFIAASDKATSQSARVVHYAEIDIMDPAQTKWRDVYEFDVPVLHVDNSKGEGDARPETNDYAPTLDAARKLMHRFTAQEVENAVDEVEQLRSSSL